MYSIVKGGIYMTKLDKKDEDTLVTLIKKDYNTVLKKKPKGKKNTLFSTLMHLAVTSDILISEQNRGAFSEQADNEVSRGTAIKVVRYLYSLRQTHLPNGLDEKNQKKSAK